MYFNFRGANIFYNIYGTKGKWLLFLHGWGGNNENFLPLYSKFSNFRCLTLDFPPFGNSSEPAQQWSFLDYCDCIIALLKQLKIKKIKIIAHSFGGRVAIFLASNYNIVESLVLVCSAGIKPKKSISTKFKIFCYKLFRKFGKTPKNFGSKDYVLLSNNMKKTFVDIVNFHLDNYCKKINCKCIIFAGQKDKETPVYMAKKLHINIKNSTLKVFKNAGHFAYLDNIIEFVQITKNFLGK